MPKCPTCGAEITPANKLRSGNRRCDSCAGARKKITSHRIGRKRKPRMAPKKPDGSRVRRDLKVPSSDKLEYARRYRLVVRALKDDRLGLKSSKAIDECAALGIALHPEPFSNNQPQTNFDLVHPSLRSIASRWPVTPPFLKCAKCGEEKTPKSFTRCKTGPYGYHSYCKCCRRGIEAVARAEGRRDYTPKDLDAAGIAKLKEQRQRWRLRNKLHVRRYNREYQKALRARLKAQKETASQDAPPQT